MIIMTILAIKLMVIMLGISLKFLTLPFMIVFGALTGLGGKD